MAEKKWAAQEQVLSIRRVSENEWHGVLLVNGQLERVYKFDTLMEVVANGVAQLPATTPFPLDTRVVIRSVIEQPVAEGADAPSGS